MAEEFDRIIQPSQPVDAENKDPLAEEVVTAWSVGMGRNEIARNLQISRYRVSKIAQAYGLEFNTEAVHHATKAHAEYAQRDRAELEARFAALAHTELQTKPKKPMMTNPGSFISATRQSQPINQ